MVAGFVRAFEANETGECWGVSAFDAEGLIGGAVSLLFARVVVVGALKGGVAEDALDLDGLASFADFSGAWLVGGVDFIGGFLEKLADELGCGFEDGGTKEFFEFVNEVAAGLGGAEGGNQFLDFFLAGDVEGFLI